MLEANSVKIRLVATIMGLGLLAGCATPPPPPPPPPSPPPSAPVKVIPPRPLPPGGATPSMYVPPRGADGLRQTVNYGLSSPQTVWNLRSALNVAALNCQDAEHAAILPAYSSLLKTHKRELSRANNRIVAKYRADYGRSGYRDAFDGYMTQVYNYFALPPAQQAFCDAALQVATDSTVVQRGGLEGFALMNLPRLEAVFDRFYSQMEQYKVDVAAWDAEYAPSSAIVTPSFVAGDGTDNASGTVTGQGISGTTTLSTGDGTAISFGSSGSQSAGPSASVDTAPVTEPAIVPVEVAPSGPAEDAGPGFSLTEQAEEPATQQQQPVFVSEPVIEAIPEDSGDGGQ